MSDRRDFLRAAGGGLVLAGLDPQGRAAAGEPGPVLFDTDVGNDIDDALCLAYLLAQPRCDLVGVTTGYGPTPTRARLVSAICRAAGRPEVPIHAGETQGLDGKAVDIGVMYDGPLDHWPHQRDFAPGEAVEFLYESLRKRPGEITLIAVGPLTNLGALFQRHPDAARLVGRVFLMNGLFTAPLPEYNASGDGRASRIVYNSTPLTTVGLDVTVKTRKSSREVHQWFQRGPAGGALRAVADMIAVWRERVPVVLFHDPLAAAMAFDDSPCRFDEVKVSVNARGVTRPDRQATPRPHRIATSVNKQKFFDHYFEVVAGLQGNGPTP